MSTMILRPMWRAVLLVLAGVGLIAGTAGVAAATPTPSGSAGAATVMTRTGSHGAYLVDGQGKSLYLFVPDTNGTSTCYGPCAVAWPPLAVPDKRTAGSGVNAAMLTTVNRNDGSKQVVYNKHPLYYWADDLKPGDTTGQGLNNLGGLWWLVNPNGTAITAK